MDDDTRTREELLAEIHALRSQLRNRQTPGDSEELRLILDAIPALVAYIDADETYCLVNRAYEDWFALPRGAIVGRKLRDILGEAAYRTVQPRIRAALAGERVSYTADLDYVHGGRRHVEASYTPHVAHDGSVRGFVALVIDTTDTHRTHEGFRFLAQATQALGTSLDFTTTLQTVTRLAVPRLGAWCSVYLVRDEPESAIDLVAVSHVDPAREAMIRALHDRWPPDRTSAFGLPQILRDGKTRLVAHVDAHTVRNLARDDDHAAALRSLGATSWIITPLVIHGHIFGAISLGLTDPARQFDPVDVALLEELARRASAALDNARLFAVAQKERARAEEANHAKDLFLSNLSHELRTPLTAVLGWTRLLRTPGLPDDRRERGLDTIDRNARAQVAIIEDILDISRIVTGKLRLELRPLDFVPLVEATVESVRPSADARNIALHIDHDHPPGVFMVRGDPDRLQQVLWNLLTNAVKFTSRGGSVHVELTVGERGVVLSVRDNGQGIDPAFLPHVFDRFRQADASTTRAHGGLGLGLAIVRHLVELHGGAVEAHSDGPGRGACFRVRFPVVADHPPLPREHRPRSEPLHRALLLAHPPDLTGVRILVVDDEPDTRDLIIGTLEPCRAVVTAVTTTADAFALLLAQPFDIVVSDIAMPHEDGYALIRKLRALPPERGGRLPTVALTAYARAEDRTRALVAGFDRHVAKPIEPTDLLITLADLCGRPVTR